MNEKKFISDERILLDEDSISYWAEELGCSKNILNSAIFQVGSKLSILRDFLEMNQHIMRIDAPN